MIETRISYISKLDNGIIRVETKKDVVLQTEDLDENFNAYQSLIEEGKALFLVIFKAGGQSSLESRLKFAEPKRARIKKAEALVIESLPHRIESNFYKRYNKPKHPVEIFTEEEKAIEWLLTFN